MKAVGLRFMAFWFSLAGCVSCLLFVCGCWCLFSLLGFLGYFVDIGFPGGGGIVFDCAVVVGLLCLCFEFWFVGCLIVLDAKAGIVFYYVFYFVLGCCIVVVCCY